jgi:oligopeptide transport system permease protein
MDKMMEKIIDKNPPVGPDFSDPALFAPVGNDEKTKAEFIRPSQTYWQDAWRRLKRDKLAVTGLCAVVAILALAVAGPWFSSYTYDTQNFMVANEPPSTTHLFGTDMFGRDIYVRVLYGARISLAVGLVASLINLTIGVLYGGVSGFVGGKTDNLMMRIVDTIHSVPLMIYVILLMVVVGPGLKSIFITLGISYWSSMARIVRSEVMRIKNEEFVLAARVLGASSRRILLQHLLPNAMGPILVTLTFSIPQAIFAESFLSFVGLGVSAPMASWGVLSNDAISTLAIYPYQLFFPAAAISVTILAFNFLGDGLRDALDPRLRK